MQNIHFIVGTGRCGTNLLNRMLDAHPQLQAVTETHFISTLATRFADVDLSAEDFWTVIDEHYTSSGQLKWTDAHLQATNISDKNIFKKEFIPYCHSHHTHAERIMAFFNFIYKKNNLDIIDKTPQYGLHIQAIARLFPQAKFIHLIRDGRFAATSMVKHPGICRLINGGHPDELINFSYKAALSQVAADEPTLQEAIKYWEKVILKIQQEAKGLPPSQYLELHYEDLLTHPHRTLETLAAFLNIRPKWFWLWRAARIPDKKILTKEHTRLSADMYDELTDLVKGTLQENGY